MAVFKSILAGLALLTASAAAVDDLGPAGFMWPADRVWSAAADNNAPCGSIAGVANRTKFPLKNGKLALIAQDESYEIELGVSYLQEPKTNIDFNNLIDAKAFRELDVGHTCINIDDAPSSVKAGANATLQLKFISDFDTPNNQTFYACADITYVELTDFNTPIPCFNHTETDDGSDKGKDGKGKDGGDHGPAASPSATPSPGGKKSGLSGGAIAGIVVGSLAAVALVGAAAMIIYRRKQQRLRALRQENSARNVKWDRQSGSNSSVRMQNLTSS